MVGIDTVPYLIKKISPWPIVLTPGWNVLFLIVEKEVCFFFRPIRR